jgi:hypothetical protein
MRVTSFLLHLLRSMYDYSLLLCTEVSAHSHAIFSKNKKLGFGPRACHIMTSALHHTDFSCEPHSPPKRTVFPPQTIKSFINICEESTEFVSNALYQIYGKAKMSASQPQVVESIIAVQFQRTSIKSKVPGFRVSHSNLTVTTHYKRHAWRSSKTG